MTIYLTDHEVSAYLTNKGLGIARATLQQWRHLGGGPNYIKIAGKVRYTQESVDKWLATFKEQSSTSAA